MNRPLLLPLALLYSLHATTAFSPHPTTKARTSSLSAQRTDKKRRFLQSAHSDNLSRNRKKFNHGPTTTPTTADTSSDDSFSLKSDEGKSRWDTRRPDRIKPPLQTSKSIEELEAILEKRWGVADGKEDFVFEDEGSSSSSATTANSSRSRRAIRDPWEKIQEPQRKLLPEESNTTNEQPYNRDEAMLLQRVKANQRRMKKTSNSVNIVSVNDKDYYDQDDEGYEAEDGSMIAPRPVGGRGKGAFAGTAVAAAALDGGIFSVRNKKSKNNESSVTKNNDEEVPTKKKKKERKVPPLEPVLDQDGNPTYLTLQQAERIVEAILSDSNQDKKSSNTSNNNNNMEIIEWETIGIINPTLLNNLYEMTCPSPLQVQIAACPPITSGNDVLLSTHTGSGKTLAFLAPIAQSIMISSKNKSTLPQALIIAPGRELASQIVSVAQQLLRGTELNVGMVIGGTSYARNVEMLRNKKPEIVVGTPGRVAELILGRTDDKGGKLKLSNLQTIVLDEFDALLQYDAHKEPTNAIIDAIERQHPSGLQRVLCSATATDMMTESNNVEMYLRRGYAHAKIESDLLVTSGGTPNGTNKGKAIRVSKTTIHGALHVPHRRFALDAVRRILNTEPVIQQALIFVDSPRRVEIVVEKLAQMDIIAAPLHGGASAGKGDRAEVSKALREGFVGVVVATEMAARGLDAPFLTHVINLDLPTDASHFAHRVGRCGRGGRPGVAISITCNDREKGVPKRFAEELGITMHDVEARDGKIRIVKR